MKHIFLGILIFLTFHDNGEAKGQFVITTPHLHVYSMDMTGSNSEDAGFFKTASSVFNINPAEITNSFSLKKNISYKSLQDFLKRLIVLSDVEPNAIVLLVDETRTLFFANESDILTKFLSSGSEFIISASKLKPSFLLESQLNTYPLSPTDFRFVNPAASIGTLEIWQIILGRLINLLHKIEFAMMYNDHHFLKTLGIEKQSGKWPVVTLERLFILDYIANQRYYSPDFYNVLFLALGGVERTNFDLRGLEDGPPLVRVNDIKEDRNPVVVHSQCGSKGGDDLLRSIYRTVFRR